MKKHKILFGCSYPPLQCGIATFSKDPIANIQLKKYANTSKHTGIVKSLHHGGTTKHGHRAYPWPGKGI